MMGTKYFLPFYGEFIILDSDRVEWLPNDNLKRTPEEQFKTNLNNGHFDGKTLTGEYTIEGNV